jgi:GGDEF domain-containing protein
MTTTQHVKRVQRLGAEWSPRSRSAVEPVAAVGSSLLDIVDRGRLETELDRIIAQQTPLQRPLSVAIISFDGLPSDGSDRDPWEDEVLRLAAEWFVAVTRVDGRVARVPGNRLALILLDVDCRQAEARLQSPLARSGWRRETGDGSPHTPVQARAAGVAQLEPGMSAEDLLDQAELAHDRAQTGHQLIESIAVAEAEPTNFFIETAGGEYRCAIRVRRIKSLFGVYEHASQVDEAAFRPRAAVEWQPASLSARASREFWGVTEHQAREKASRAFARWVRSQP